MESETNKARISECEECYHQFNKRTTYVDPWVSCGLGMAVFFDTLATIRARSFQLHRNFSFAVAGEGRRHGMAEPVQRGLKERQFISSAVCDRSEYNEPD